MNSDPLAATPEVPAELNAFLDQKRPSRGVFTTYGNEYAIELVADREADSLVGWCHFDGVVASDVDEVRAPCRVRLGSPSELHPEQLEWLARHKSGPLDSFWIIEDRAGGLRFCVGRAIRFTTQPWIDLGDTRRIEQANPCQRRASPNAVASHFADSDAGLIGREVGCWQCLRTYRVERVYASCPWCKNSASATSVERLLAGGFHSNATLLARSGCGPLHHRAPDEEVYRLVVYSRWLNHRIVEVSSRQGCPRLVAQRWHSRTETWGDRIDRDLTREEWHRLGWLLDAAPFWHLPPHGGHHGFDGAYFTVEGLREGVYHFVERWGPDPECDEENFAHVCGFLLEMAAAADGK